MNFSYGGIDVLQNELSSRSTVSVAFESGFYVVLSILTLLGNFLTLWIILASQSLRSCSTNIFIATLALSDFLMAFLSMHLLVVVLITSKWPFGEVVCQYQGFVAVVLAAASTQTLAWTAVNRYIRICEYQQFNYFFSEKKTKLVILQIWVGSFLAPLPYVAAGNKFVFNPGKFFCYMDIEVAWFTAVLVAIYVGIPSSVISFCYFKVYQRVRQHNKKISQQRANSQSLTVEDIRMTHTLFVIVVVFMFCWIPALIIDIIDTFKRRLSLPRMAYFCYTIFASISYASNPIIYGVMNPMLRRRYFEILSCHKMCDRGKFKCCSERKSSKSKDNQNTQQTQFPTNAEKDEF